MQSHRHIDYLVDAAKHYDISWYDHEDIRSVPFVESQTYYRRARDTEDTEIGSVLVAEQLASVSHRYPDDSLDDLPGYIPDVGKEYEHHNTMLSMNPVFILHACNGYEYQSCEHPGWPKSEAFRIIEAIRSAAVSQLTETAPTMFWSLDPESVSA